MQQWGHDCQEIGRTRGCGRLSVILARNLPAPRMASRLRQRAGAEAKPLLVTIQRYASPGGAAFRRESLQTLYTYLCRYAPT